ncbi:uncharacterized protein LOC117580860 [Drosophila guanche]|uniref:Uncharacterized protein n=1 Tax=Drosophila guanche TaxID=7266 RepID=A0A3B0JT37_DROGU|nr:uncharacterized protein LOC117580860 [Drosophila guanche]SPP78630.1 Hypothetical predicted protein [Drosophila guanche]
MPKSATVSPEKRRPGPRLRIPSSVSQGSRHRNRRSSTRGTLASALDRLVQMEKKLLLQTERHDQLLSSLQESGGPSAPNASVDTLIQASEQEEQTSHGRGQSWQTFMDSVRCRLSVNQVVRQVRNDATLTLDFVVLLVAAALISCLGLVGNSYLLLSSSMLISPLMGPIIAGTFGLVIGDRGLWWLGFKNELIGIALSAGIGFIFGILVFRVGPFFAIASGLTEEIVSRCTIHALIIGVVTALASGAAGAIAVLGGNTGSLAGVAISASLLPPAVNAGLLWALAFGTRVLDRDHELIQSLSKHHEYSNDLETELLICALVSMALALVNVICIWVTGVIVLLIKEVTPAMQRNQKFWRHDIRTALKAAHQEPDLQDAINRWEARSQSQMEFGAEFDLEAPHYQHTWSPGMDRVPLREHQQSHYHTVHGFHELCFTLQKLKQDQVSAVPGTGQRGSSTGPSVMELYESIRQEKAQKSVAPKATRSETALTGMATAEERPSTSHGLTSTTASHPDRALRLLPLGKASTPEKDDTEA